MATNDQIMAQCAETRADVKNICQTLDKMQVYISKNIDQYTAINARLAVIERVQNDMRDGNASYQDNCSHDRISFDKRVTSVEGFQMRQIKVATLVSSFVAFVMTVGIDLLKK